MKSPLAGLLQTAEASKELMESVQDTTGAPPPEKSMCTPVPKAQWSYSLPCARVNKLRHTKVPMNMKFLKERICLIQGRLTL